MSAKNFLFSAAATVAGLWLYNNFGSMLPNVGSGASK